METLESVLSQIEDSTLLSDAIFKSGDADSVLDDRDSQTFEERWLHASKVVENAWKSRPDLHANTLSINRVRELSFRRVFQATGGHHDLAAAISDDFELICKKRLTAMSETFVDELECAYREHRLPCKKTDSTTAQRS